MNLFTAAELSRMDIKTPEFIVDGLLPVGVSFLVGKPKTGKSLLAMQLSLDIANSQRFLGRNTKPGSVLYIDLETHLGHLLDRLVKQSEGQGLPESLAFASGAPGLSKGLEKAIEEYLVKTPDAVLVVIDTFGRVMPDRGPGKNDYLHSIHMLEPLGRLAEEYEIAIVLVHHARKSGPGGELGDPFESIMGSQGLYGTADGAMVLNRESSRSQATLYVRGRAMEESELDLQFNSTSLLWRAGEPPTASQQLGFKGREEEIFELLADQELSGKELAQALGILPNNVGNTLKKMVDKNVIERRPGHKYGLSSSLLADLTNAVPVEPNPVATSEHISEMNETSEEEDSEEIMIRW